MTAKFKTCNASWTLFAGRVLCHLHLTALYNIMVDLLLLPLQLLDMDHATSLAASWPGMVQESHQCLQHLPQCQRLHKACLRNSHKLPESQQLSQVQVTHHMLATIQAVLTVSIGGMMPHFDKPDKCKNRLQQCESSTNSISWPWQASDSPWTAWRCDTTAKPSNAFPRISSRSHGDTAYC
jgi:hypothetical protein